jgi:hypothetical protein
MLEELTTQWIETHYFKEGYDFWSKIRITKRLLYKSEPCNNVSKGSTGNRGEGVPE